MSVSETFRSLALDQLARIAPDVKARRMFGGVGIYSRGAFFALLDDDRLYLKTDAETRSQFQSRGWPPFRPFGDDRMTIQYYEVPLEVIEQAEELRPWAELALAAAARASAARKSRLQRTKRPPRVSVRIAGRKPRPGAGRPSRNKRKR